jgi:hypothetical protein
MTGAGFQRLLRRGSSHVIVAALAAAMTTTLGTAPVSAGAHRPLDMASASVRTAHSVAVKGVMVVDLTGTRRGDRLAQAAHIRFGRQGFEVAASDLEVLRDAAGLLVVPRGTDLGIRSSASQAGSGAAISPIARPAPAGVSASAAAGNVAAAPMSWTVVYSGCYERLSDSWSWIDHCARILQLKNDGDLTMDSYALERWATAGANWPWVLKSAAISAYPTEAGPALAWVDWIAKSDRVGACQQYSLRLLNPYPTTARLVDRCETWDITKASRGGDFRLDWRGCTCTHDRELAFSLSVSVAQGRLPSWYVPADVHGYPF